MKRLDRLQSAVRSGYVLLYILFMTAVYCVPVWAWTQGRDGLVITGFVYAGVGLLVWDLFTKRRFLRVRNVDVLLLFYIIYGIGVVINYRYGIVTNVKGMLWMGVVTFLVGSFEPDDPKKWLLRLADAFLLLWTVFVVWSIAQYVVQYATTAYVTLDGQPYPQRLGFHGGRLFGVFRDPNYGAVCSLVALGLAVLGIKCAGRGRPAKLAYGAAAVLSGVYVVLSGSRTAQLAAAVALATVALVVALGRLQKRKLLLRLGGAALAMVLAAVCVFALWETAKLGLSYAYIPASTSAVEQPDQEQPGQPQEGGSILDREDLQQTDDFTNNRTTIWAECLQLVKTHPLLGTTPRGYMEAAKEQIPDSLLVTHGYSIHNGYLSLLVCTGVLGALAMLAWCVLQAVALLRYLVRRWSSKDGYYWPILICTAIVAAIAVSAFPLQSVFFCFQIPDLLFWLLLGLSMTLLRHSEPERYRMSLTERLLNRVIARFQRKKS